MCKLMHCLLISIYVLPPVMTVNNAFTNDYSLIINIHDESDGWIFCERNIHKVMNAYILVVFVLV
jgi:hypothetical protein